MGRHPKNKALPDPGGVSVCPPQVWGWHWGAVWGCTPRIRHCRTPGGLSLPPTRVGLGLGGGVGLHPRDKALPDPYESQSAPHRCGAGTGGICGAAPQK